MSAGFLKRTGRGMAVSFIAVCVGSMAAPAAHAVRATGNCRLDFSPATTQRCFPPTQVAAAERRLPTPPLSPSAAVFAGTGLSLTQVIDTKGLGYDYAGGPYQWIPAINYLYGKVPAVHGYLRLTHRNSGSAVWQRPHFVVVREVVGKYTGTRALSGAFSCPLWYLPGRLDMVMDQTIAGCGLSYFITYLPRWHVSLFVSTNIGPAVVREVGQIIVATSRGGK